MWWYLNKSVNFEKGLNIKDMESINSSNSQNTNLYVSENIRQKMLSSMKWLNFLTVMLTISVVFLLIGAVTFFIAGSKLDVEENPYGGTTGYILGVVYFILAAAYAYPIVKSYSMIDNVRLAMINNAQDNFEQSANECYSILKYFGIMTISFIALYVVFIIAAIIVIVYLAATGGL